ncbi:MAG: hypothetical protein LBC89_03300 [Bacteroidales bacterium]|jgi:hypothetical protein|nr:hypothetical protein [Bacteroidales bacterium]
MKIKLFLTMTVMCSAILSAQPQRVPPHYSVEPVDHIEGQITCPISNCDAFAYDEIRNIYYVAQSKKNTSNIYAFAQNKNGKWKSTKLSFYNKKFYFTDPTLSKNGNVMVLSVKIAEKYDLYITKRNEYGNWTVPMRINALSNNSNNCKAMLYCDSLLFYSSDRPDGFGNLDIWYSKISYNGKTIELDEETKLNEVTFSEAANIGNPYNSEGNDYSLTMNTNGHGGFLLSDRSGKELIYSFVVNPPVLVHGREPNSIDRVDSLPEFEESDMVIEEIIEIEEAGESRRINNPTPTTLITPVTPIAPTTMTYRVQFAAMSYPIDVLTVFHKIYEHFPYTVIEEQVQEDHLNHYVTKEYQSLEEARGFVIEIKNLGLDAFVARYIDGRRIR